MKKQIFIYSIVITLMFSLSGCGCSKPNEELINNKIIKNEALNKEQEVEGLVFSNLEIKYDGENTEFISKVENVTDEPKYVEWVKAEVEYNSLDKKTKEVEFLVYFGEEIPAKETRTTTTSIDIDLRQTKKVKYKLVK